MYDDERTVSVKKCGDGFEICDVALYEPRFFCAENGQKYCKKRQNKVCGV